MTRYANVSGRSGVVEYEVGEHYIKVRFIGNPKVYVYDYYEPGIDHVETMKELAEHGEGLATYIARNVRESYARIE